MIIKIDTRERKLIPICKQFLEELSIPNTEIKIESLDLGDAVITDNEGNDLLIIERKSLNDLACSIRDGRYAEQSYRLMHNPVHNHNIIYIIEGDIDFYQSKFTRINRQSLFSAIFSLQYYKGFSIIWTKNILETSEYIMRSLDKLQKENTKGKKPHFINGVETESKNEEVEEPTQKDYCKVVKKTKKDNITHKNIGEIILSQIPGVSTTIATTIINHFTTFHKMMKAIEVDREKCLTAITYQTNTGKTRHVSNTACKNIVNYLLDSEEQVLFVET